MADALTDETTSGHLSWQLGVCRLGEIRRRIEREGLDHEAAVALQQTFADIAIAAVELDVERVAAFAATALREPA